MNSKRTGRRYMGNRRGNAVIEFALAFVVMVPLFLGTYEFGYAFYVYNSLQSAVRSGARYASVRSYDSSTPTPSTNYTLSVQNMVVYGDPNGGVNPVVPGLTPADVSVEMNFVAEVPRQVTVRIPSYETSSAVSMVEFTSKPHLAVPFTGRYDGT